MEASTISIPYEEACNVPGCRQPFLNHVDVGSLRELAALHYVETPPRNDVFMCTQIDPIGLACRSAIEAIRIDVYPAAFEFPENDFLSILRVHERQHVLNAIRHKWFLLRRLPIMKAAIGLCSAALQEANTRRIVLWEELDELHALRAQRRCAEQSGITSNLFETITGRIQEQQKKLRDLIRGHA